MMNANLLLESEAATYGAALVGAIFLWAAVVKAANPDPFIEHLRRLGFFEREHLRAAAVAAVGLESAWGTGLLLGAAPGVLLPATLVLLTLFTGLTIWSTSTGRTEDCGCYGGQVAVSPGQSVALNAVYAALVVVAWLAVETPPSPVLPAGWKLGTVVGAGLATAGLAIFAGRYATRHGEPLLGRSPLREERRWRKGWAAGAVARDAGGEVMVVYLGPTCPHCQRWGRILNVIHQVPSLPSVVGVVKASDEERSAFAETHGLRFPMVSIRRSLFDRLISAVPTTVLVEDGLIKQIWLGSMPEEGFLDRFKRAIFPALAARAREEAGDGGGATG